MGFTRKLGLLVGMAMVSLVFAASASASSQWTKTVVEEGVLVTGPLKEQEATEFDGRLKLESLSLPGNSFECDFDGEATLVPPSGGEIETLAFDKASCIGKGVYEGCELTGSSAALDGDLQATQTVVLKNSPLIWSLSFKGCGLGGSEFTGSVTAALNSYPGELSDLTLSGTGALAGLGGYKISGNMSIGPSGQYGVEMSPEWTKTTGEGTTPLAKEEAVALDGTLGFAITGIPGKFECGYTGEGTLTPGDEGKISSLSINMNSCKGYDLFTGCTLQNSTLNFSTGIKAVPAKGAIFSNASIAWKFTYKPGCVLGSSELNSSNLAATLASAGVLSNLSLAGTGTAKSLGVVSIYGKLNFLPAGVYGIG